MADVEEAVADHYVTVAIPTDLRDRIHRGVDTALDTATTINGELVAGIATSEHASNARSPRPNARTSKPAATPSARFWAAPPT